MTQAYRSAVAFKQALDQRLRTESESGTELARKRQLVVFDRFLARVARELGDSVTLKGGLAVELRLARARGTKDVELRMVGSSTGLHERLRRAAEHDLGDFMEFTIRPDDRHPEIRGEGMQYEGLRFRAECSIASKVYGTPFGVDVAFGDPMFGEPELVVADDVLAFAGIAPPTLRLYPIETHLAEKLHAYTIPRQRPNSRVKDLPDIALLATSRRIEAKGLRAAPEQTFAFRATHPLPAQLAAPPEAWTAPYAAMAQNDLLRWRTLGDVTTAARSFIDPVLAGGLDAQWMPTEWQWR